jgi:hypothetical protein
MDSLLLIAQKVSPGLPMRWIASLAGIIQPQEHIAAIMQLYWRAIDLSKIGWPSKISDHAVGKYPPF